MTRLRLVIVIVIVWLLPRLAFGAVVDDLKALVEQGKAREAFSLGLEHPDLFGNPEFDFLFGVAAIDAGNAGQGILALERFLLNFPDNDRARLELGRGYFVLNEDARAREEFEGVRAKSPPADVLATIDRYLEAIRAREGRYQTTSRFYVEGGVGSDSNVNAGVGGANITLPVLGTVTVSGTGTRTGDMFTHLGAGGQVTKPVAAGVSVFGAFDTSLKLHSSDSAFDQQNVNFAGGVNLLRDKNLFRAALSHGWTDVENDRFRSVTGLGGEWHRQLNELRSASVVAQYAELDYPGANRVRKARLSGAGVGIRQGFAAAWQPVASVSLNYGDEHNTESRPDLGRKVVVLRAGLNLSPHPKWGLSGAYVFNDSRYGADDPILLATRKDKQTALELGAIYLHTRNLSFRGELFWTTNHSNLALYQFDRTMIAFKARYEF